jgi:hypothetical protein
MRGRYHALAARLIPSRRRRYTAGSRAADRGSARRLPRARALDGDGKEKGRVDPLVVINY